VVEKSVASAVSLIVSQL